MKKGQNTMNLPNMDLADFQMLAALTNAAAAAQQQQQAQQAAAVSANFLLMPDKFVLIYQKIPICSLIEYQYLLRIKLCP